MSYIFFFIFCCLFIYTIINTIVILDFAFFSNNTYIDKGYLTYANNSTELSNKYLFKWVKAASVWDLWHLLANIELAVFFTTSILKEINANAKIPRTILLTIGWASLFEVLEKFATWLVNVAAWKYNGKYKVLNDLYIAVGLGEPIFNTLFSDIPMAVYGSLGILLITILFLPPSFVIFDRKWYKIVIRFLFFCFSNLPIYIPSIFVYRGHYYFGFYSVFFYKIAQYLIMYSWDTKISEINFKPIYRWMFGLLIVLFISCWNLTIPTMLGTLFGFFCYIGLTFLIIKGICPLIFKT